ncbi:Vacuolar protein sorting-associated protein vps5 [Mucor velutinosus]|uniref:Vacuolar protein sorting-associated protein vps5 n=1 Tax=Mucor velutinosus TaxID=708070 RepID=A0AAN7DHQ0_9FUNG|nr:Vacuolar protein sorting-associated protein vps5 [Mucor velutinosus]
MRRDNNRIFAEISVSPSMYQQILQQPALQLENFEEPLMTYPTLSPSANIVKLSLIRLPAQYGRKDGGNTQLKADMHHNLEKFGQLIDCSYVTGGSSVYAGGGYAVLDVNATHAKLEHSLNWAYHPIDYVSGDLMEQRDHVLSLAT